MVELFMNQIYLFIVYDESRSCGILSTMMLES